VWGHLSGYTLALLLFITKIKKTLYLLELTYLSLGIGFSLRP
jgi:hypothetical protein